MTLLHALTHWHMSGSRDGVGEIAACGFRLSANVSRVWFRPDFDGARWHPLGCDLDLVDRIMECETAHEAMALIRAQA